MNTNKPTTPPSLLSQEAKASAGKLATLVNILLNKVFALNRKAAQTRQIVFVILLLMIGFWLGLQVVPFEIWKNDFSFFFVNMFKVDVNGMTDAMTILIVDFIRAFFYRDTFRYLPIFLSPFLLAWHFAGVYLQDIFELEHLRVAKRFVMRAAFGTRYEKIHIREGQIADEDRESPVYQIGGPGLVQVELDSAAVFEDADGKPRIIGPTLDDPDDEDEGNPNPAQNKRSEHKAKGGFIELTGFERLREAYDIRDHFTKPLSVGGRTLDGINIQAQDVRLVYSIYRGEEPPAPTLERPYPFEESAIRALTFNRTHTVTPGSNSPSKGGPWQAAMAIMIRGKMGGFIGSHKLVEFLASINVPEKEKTELKETELDLRATYLAESQNGQSKREPVEIPKLTPRDQISNMFARFAEDFTKTEKQRGVQLRWIGVGTWQPPDAVSAKAITESHLEAWKISRENAARSNAPTLRSLGREASLAEIMRMVQEVPINEFRTAKNKYQDVRAIMQSILEKYREQIIKAIEKYSALSAKQKKENKPPEPLPRVLLQARDMLTDIIYKDTHRVGKPPRRSMYEKFSEQDLYNQLLQLVGGNMLVADYLIAHEQELNPNDDRKDWIARAIAKWLRDRGAAS